MLQIKYFCERRLVWFVPVLATTQNLYQGSHGDCKTWKMKIVMEKSWNMKNLPKVMEFCDQSWNFTNFVPKMLPNLYLFFCLY